MKKKLLLIVNPTSGKMKIKTELLGILKLFSEADYSVSVHVTRRQKDATWLVEQCGAEFDSIIACGGDGTLNEVVAGALRSHYAGSIGFLPCGTTNDLATTLGLPKTLSRAAKVVISEEARPMDFATFNRTRYFTYIASFGAFSDVSYTTDQNLKNLLGHAAYVVEAALTLDRIRTHQMRVEYDGGVLEDEFLFGAVANSFSIGGVLKLKKNQVDLADGFHEVLLVRKPKTSQDLANLSKELLSGNFENKSILFFRTKKILFQCDEAIPWTTDGEYAGEHEKVEIRNLKQRLNVIRP